MSTASWTVVSRPSPPLNIPASKQTVEVSIIDSTSRIGNIEPSMLVKPQVGIQDRWQGPAYSFLIENEAKGKKILFDLGVRKDWENMAPHVTERIKSLGWTIDVTKNVSDILQENGIPLNSINAIVWSHWHWDHQGDPSQFPSSTDLIVGPGFKERRLPGYPTVSDAAVTDSAFAGRTVRELSPETDSDNLKLGRFNAVDYFGDGSFYLLFSPGHTADHICGLARTTSGSSTSGSSDSFIFMAADAVHHGGEYKPTQYLPLPEKINPDPKKDMLHALNSVCPGDVFYKLHPTPSATEPFVQPAGAEDMEQCIESIRSMEEFDGHENVLCVFAHDQSLLDVLEFYPKSANDWMKKGWKEKGLWRFLGEFVEKDV